MAKLYEAFPLKEGDTLPVLTPQLLNPNGSVHDLSGSTAWRLLIWLSDGSRLVRPMTIDGDPIDGTLRYEWVPTDWDPPSGGDPATVGGLVAGPDLPLSPGTREHWIEYEVTAPSGVLTFPNDGYDVLRITRGIG